MRPSLSQACFAGVVLASVFSVAGQAPTPTTPDVFISEAAFMPVSVFEASTALVNVDVVVRDPDGHTVANLTKDDFLLEDNGKPRAITSFRVFRSAGAAADSAPASTAAPAAAAPPVIPRYVAMFFDDLHTEAPQLLQAKAAAAAFLKTGFGAEDHVGVFTSSGLTTLAYTQDAAAVAAAIAAISPHVRFPDRGEQSCPLITPDMAYNIANNLDARAMQVAVAQAIECNCAGQNNPPGEFEDVGFAQARRGRGAAAGGGGSPCPRLQRQFVQQQADVLWQNVEDQSIDTLSAMADVVNDLVRQTGEKSLLIVSSGFLNGGLDLQADEQALIQGAMRDGVVINALDARGLWTDDASLGGEVGNPLVFSGTTALAQHALATDESIDVMNAMDEISAGTGGRLFQNSNDLRAGMQQLVAAPEVSYLLGFSAGDVKPDGTFHHLDVKLRAPGHLQLQARKGYFAPGLGQSSTWRQKALAAAMATTDQTQLDASVQTRPASAPHAIQVDMHVAPRSLHWTKVADRSCDQLLFLAYLTDAHGNRLTGKQALVTLNLRPSAPVAVRIKSQGLGGTMSISAPAGNYQLRGVVAEAGQGLVSTFTRSVTVP